ncbi:hypothetical protein BV96_03974 [Sphingomonas paucimobilis]|nr:hypothetical protein BV96_03974 [Sphingomonas paucimobilis]
MSNIYVSPTGSGNKSGSDWANALAIDNLNSAIKKAGAGGTVLLAADVGTYNVKSAINISGAGTADAAVTIKGVSTKTGLVAEAVFEGTRPVNWTSGSSAGNELFKFQAGAANLKFEHLQINNTGTVFRAAADISNITIQHVDADNVARFFEDFAGSGNITAKVKGLTISDVDVHGFSQGVVRLQYGSENILIENVRGDSEGQDGEFAIGIHLHGLAHDVVIRQTSMTNAKYTGTGYWNGDGFATEVGVYNVLFEDTVASGNADAGYDLKSTATKLVRAVSSDNAHNFRIWGEAEMIDSVGLNPHARGGTAGQYQVWVKADGSLKMTGGMLADSGAETTVFAAGANLVMADTQIVMANSGAKLGGANLPTGLNPTDVVKVAATGKFSTTAGAFDLDAFLAAAKDAAAVKAVKLTTAPSTPAASALTMEPVKEVPQKTVVTDLPHFKFVSTSGSETHSAANKAAVFVFDMSSKQGADNIIDFGQDDLLVTQQAIKDGNNDGLIAFSKQGALTLNDKAGTVSLPGLTEGLRLLGQTEDGFAYADASVRPNGAKESKLGVGDSFTGDAKDKNKNVFFFDTALDRSLGYDKLALFGAKDVVVTTTKLADVAESGKLVASDGSFTLVHEDHGVGTLAITDLKGASVTALEYDGERVVGNVHYYVYSSVGSAVGLEALAF